MADASQVDWARAESSAEGVEEAQVIRELRILATLRQVAAAQAVTWGPLELRGVVGKGSFGTVHRAWDGRLNREVALKLLTSQAGPQASSRLLAEGRLLAQVRHPNVVTVFAIDEHDGRGGIAMEFVDGRTLKEIVESQGPFGAHEAVLIGRDLCRALAEVHRLGLLHRDIKAQNVMREAGGRIVLMDFGAGMSAFDNERPLAGTPVYAAPEVLSGERPDAQADLYSLGVLLFFLVTGAFPVVGQTLDEVRDRHARGTRQRLRDLRPQLPDAFVRTVESAIAAVAVGRPRSAGELEQVLGDVLRDTSGSLVPDRSPVPVPHSHAATGWESLALVPLEVPVGGAEVGFIASGFLDEVATRLRSLPDLRILAGPSVRRAARDQASPYDISTQLGVDGVLHGRLALEDDIVRVDLRMTDGVDGGTAWREAFRCELQQFSGLPVEVARKVALSLRGAVSGRDADALSRTGTADATAYQLWLKGLYAWSIRSAESIRKAIDLFEAATVQDGGFAEAYASLSTAYHGAGVHGILSRSLAQPRAAAAARRSLELAPDLPEGHAALGFVLKNQFRWAEANACFVKAIALRPGSAQFRHWYSVLLTQLGRFPQVTHRPAASSRAYRSRSHLALHSRMFAAVSFGSCRYRARSISQCF